jgi:hypothetical protein
MAYVSKYVFGHPGLHLPDMGKSKNLHFRWKHPIRRSGEGQQRALTASFILNLD